MATPRRRALWHPERWAERTLDVHVNDSGVCEHCLSKYRQRRRWPCDYAKRALEIKGS